MLTDQSLKKLFRFALLTSPLFGLFDSSPGFSMREFEMERLLRMFLVTTSFTFLFWLVNIGLLWSNLIVLRNKIIRFIITAIICGIIAYVFFLLLDPVMAPARREFTNRFPNPPHPRREFFFITKAFSINFIIFILIELILLRETKNKVALENEQLKLANSEARNSQLQQQLHPHFLFNSLATLRSLINRSPEQAQDYLEKLSELLRFSTNNSQRTLVLLKEEVELCTNYLKMQEVRFGAALNFSINIPEQIQNSCKVPVYSLQQLAENAIKHNVLTRELPLLIEIDMDDTNEWIAIKNNLQPKQVKEFSNGVGLANLSERYRLLNNEDIYIKKDAASFCVRIKIFCDESNHN